MIFGLNSSVQAHLNNNRLLLTKFPHYMTAIKRMVLKCYYEMFEIIKNDAVAVAFQNSYFNRPVGDKSVKRLNDIYYSYL